MGSARQQDRRRRSTLLLPAAVLCPGQGIGKALLGKGSRIDAAVNFAQGKGKGMAAVNPVTLLPLPAAGQLCPLRPPAVLCPGQGQRGGRRRLTANSAQGKGMGSARQQDRRRRSTLLLPAAVLCPGQGIGKALLGKGSRIDAAVNFAQGKGKGMAAVNPVTLLPLPAAGQLCPLRPPAVLCPGQGQRGGRRRLTANSAQGKGMGSARQQDRRRRSTLLLPAAVLCPGQGIGKALLGKGSRIDAAVNFAQGKGKGMAAVNPVTLLPLPAAGQLCPLRPANAAQGSISAAFFAQGKGMGKGSARQQQD